MARVGRNAQKSLREQIIGTWDFVVAEITGKGGKAIRGRIVRD
jgi:hypothetical protein